MPNEVERVIRYAERYWLRHDMTEWPTVRQTARSLRMRISEVVEAIDDSGGGADLESYNTYPPHPIADHTIYVYSDVVEDAWNRYWGVKAVPPDHPANR